MKYFNLIIFGRNLSKYTDKNLRSKKNLLTVNVLKISDLDVRCYNCYYCLYKITLNHAPVTAH